MRFSLRVSSFTLTLNSASVYHHFSIMWSLRRVSHSFKKQGHCFAASTVFSAKSDILSDVVGGRAGIYVPEKLNHGGYLLPKCFYHTPLVHENLFVGIRNLCSQVGATRSSDENDDIEDGFTEIESPAAADIHDGEEDGEELESKSEFLDNDLLDTEMGESSEDFERRRASEELFKAIMDQGPSILNVLNKWVEDGNKLDRTVITRTIINLQNNRVYGKALQFSEWLESSKQLDFTEWDYASRLELIARARGLQMAETYVEKIPVSCKGEPVYRALLASCVRALNMRKGEAVLKKMRELELPLTVHACNQMIILYKRLNRKKIADILLLMEKETVKPSLLTFKLLMDTKGESNDIVGMEQLFEEMKAEGVEPDIYALTILAKHYISGGFKDKAETILKEIEKGNMKESFGARKALLRLNASLGKTNEVGKIWEECKLDPKITECMAAIEAFGKLGNVEEAEAIFEMMLQKWKRLSSRHYSALLKVYINHKLVTKGKELVKQMGDSGCWFGPLSWDALVRLYLEAGDVAKADSILQKAAQQNRKKPMFTTYMIVMEQYAKRGDIHNSEKLFKRLKESGYTGRLKPFEVLIQAYINAKTPAYGFPERMKADDIFPNRAFAVKLALADAFWKTPASELLD